MSGGGRMLEDFLARLRRSVYRDEPLVRSSDEAPAGKVPKLIRAMRSLAQVSGSCWQPREEIFLKQARLMERYEDDFVFEGEVTRYYPTYESLSDAELRGYFAWRTQVRKGRIVPAPLTFAMLYAYEILHLIGCRDAADGYGKLMELGLEFGMTEPALYTYLPAWTYGYVIYYGLDPEYLSDSSYYRDMKLQDEAIAAVLSRGEHPAEEIAAGLCALSSYRLERSKFYRTYTSDMSAVIMRVIARVAEYYEKHRKRNFSSEYIGHECRRLTRIFPGAVFHARSPEEERVYTVNPVRSYECAGGAWYMLAYERELKQARRLGALLRLIDYRMRECTGFPSIKPPKKTTKWLAKIVDEEIEAFFAKKGGGSAPRAYRSLAARAYPCGRRGHARAADRRGGGRGSRRTNFDAGNGRERIGDVAPGVARIFFRRCRCADERDGCPPRRTGAASAPRSADGRAALVGARRGAYCFRPRGRHQ